MGRYSSARASVGVKARARSNGGRIRRQVSKTKKGQRIDFDVSVLQTQYQLPLRQAAENLGVCEAVLKRICRRKQIAKWPYRHLKSLAKKIDLKKEEIQSLDQVVDSTAYLDAVRDLTELIEEREAMLNNSTEPKQENIEAELEDIFGSPEQTPSSPSTSYTSESSPPRASEQAIEHQLFDRSQFMPFLRVDTSPAHSPTVQEASFAEEATKMFDYIPEMDLAAPGDPFLKEFQMKFWSETKEDCDIILGHPESLFRENLSVH